MDFYAEKSKDLPRFIYRKLASMLAAAHEQGERDKIIEEFCHHVVKIQPTDDWYKLKWCLPGELASLLTEDERGRVDNALGQKRKKRNERFLEVYPNCSDEFSTDGAFLDATFGARSYQLIDKNTKLFTFGSCFARNIAHYLSSKGYDITPFVQVEDLNSPFSNAIMLCACVAPEAERRAYVERWLGILYPDARDLKQMASIALNRLDDLRTMIKESDFLIVTCGNVIDYFLDDKSASFTTAAAVAPKFLSVSFKEDVTVQGSQTARLKAAGAVFRLGSYEEVRGAMDALYAAIRQINPTAYLLVTLSPIPIASAMGMSQPYKMGAIEIDCISKSLLRSVLYEMMLEYRADKNLFYFPSFEVVRWISPNRDCPVFGKEDACSHHVSQDNLTGIYEYFLRKFGKTTVVEEEETGADKNIPDARRRKRKRWWRFW